MTLAELKAQLLANKVPTGLLVFVCPENYFIADQYIEKICSIHKLLPVSISSLAKATTASNELFFTSDSELKILRTDTFAEYGIPFETLNNTVVLCKKVDKTVADVLTKYIIEIPKLTDWQIKDYIKTVCIGLDDPAANWLYEATRGDIYKISNELDKLLLFSPKERIGLLNDLRFEPGSDLYAVTNFIIKDAILQKDIPTLNNFLAHSSSVDIEPFSLIGLLLSVCKNAEMLLHGSKSPADLGISNGYANVLRGNARFLSSETLHEIIKFLTAIDKRLKLGELELSKENLLSYIICNMLRILTK